LNFFGDFPFRRRQFFLLNFAAAASFKWTEKEAAELVCYFCFCFVLFCFVLFCFVLR